MWLCAMVGGGIIMGICLCYIVTKDRSKTVAGRHRLLRVARDNSCIGLIALRTLNSFLHLFQVGSAGNSVGATCVANSLNSRHGFEMCLFPR